MRKELELMALIDEYLRNELDSNERAAFEERLRTDAQLQEEVALQRELVEGLQRMGIRHQVQQAYRKYHWQRNGWKWGLGGAILVIALAIAVLFYLSRYGEDGQRYILPELNELGQTEWADADAYLPYQHFTIDPTKDTVIESVGGIVLAIPAGAFLDVDGSPVKGRVQFEFKEALDGVSMIASGLGTTSNGRPLETGGMFYLNARKNGASLKMDECKPLYVQVPAVKEDPEMMLFDGERMPDGSINWVNPKPQEDFLIPVDIFSLYFYPLGYLDSLRAWGYEADNKPWRDSVFYNANCGHIAAAPAEGTPAVSMDTAAPSIAYSPSDREFGCKGIMPSDIKAIWNERYQGTFIATKEFEERLKYLYQGCWDEALHAYIHSLNKPMYVVDSMLGSIGPYSMSGQFREFAKQRKGRVAINDALAKELGEYYTLKSNAYKAAVAATYQKLAAENEQDVIQLEKEAGRLRENYQKEFDLNLKEAYRQLGYDPPTVNTASWPLVRPVPSANPVPPSVVVTVSVNSPGWKNIDRYLTGSVVNRESLDFADEEGNAAKIAYNPLTVTVGYPDRFEKLYVYLLTPKLNSFLRMPREGGVFKENLNGLLTYHVACIGYMDGQLYFSKETHVDAPRELKIDLRKLPETELAAQLKGLYPDAAKDMQQELDYQSFIAHYQQRQQEKAAVAKFNNKMNPVIFPCMPSCESGEKTFKALCASCHKLDAKLIGPALGGALQRWSSTPDHQGYSGRMWLKEWIRNWQVPVKAGHPYAVQMQSYDGSAQPQFPQLTDDDLESLLMYMDYCMEDTPALE